jgi:hypothetical protein
VSNPVFKELAMKATEVNNLRVKPRPSAGLMKHLILAGALVAGTLFSRADLKQSTWGSATNGARLGMETYTRDSFGKDCPPFSILYVQNVSTNFVYLVFPKLDRRYTAELRGPGGQRVGLRTGKKLSDHDKVVRRGLKPNEIEQIDHFSIPDVFVLLTNGTYELVISARACTNVLWKGEPVYFLLPPVTNIFDVTIPAARGPRGSGTQGLGRPK